MLPHALQKQSLTTRNLDVVKFNICHVLILSFFAGLCLALGLQVCNEGELNIILNVQASRTINCLQNLPVA